MTAWLYLKCLAIAVSGVVVCWGWVMLFEALGWMPYDEDGNPR